MTVRTAAPRDRRGEPSRSNPGSHAFSPLSHDSDAVDPNLLAVPPHDPYSLLQPGAVISADDIKRIVGEGQQWVPIEPHEIGHSVPSRGVAYGRVEAPENFLLALRDKIVSPEMLVWTSNTGAWQSAVQFPEVSGRNVGELMDEFLKQHNQLLFVAVNDPTAPLHQALDVPARHRVLYPGERLRRGDRMIFQGLTAWIAVDVITFDQPVTMPDGANGEVRFCRPTGPHFQNWYVDQAKGKPENMGGAADPWPAVAFAEGQIEAASKSAGVSPHGIIWEGSTPRMVYDLSEQPDRVVVSTRDRYIDEILQEEDARTIAAITQAAIAVRTPEQLDSEAAQPVRPREAQRRLPPPAACESVEQLARRLQCGTDEIREDATRQLPRGFRFMQGMEEIGRGDLLYQFDEALETAGWKAAPEPLFGSLVGNGDEMPLFARRTVSKAPVKELLLKAQQQHLELGNTIAELSAILNQQ